MQHVLIQEKCGDEWTHAEKNPILGTCSVHSGEYRAVMVGLAGHQYSGVVLYICGVV